MTSASHLPLVRRMRWRVVDQLLNVPRSATEAASTPSSWNVHGLVRWKFAESNRSVIRLLHVQATNPPPMGWFQISDGRIQNIYCSKPVGKFPSGRLAVGCRVQIFGLILVGDRLRASWRNWQTRWIQNPVPVRAYRFDSDRGH